MATALNNALFLVTPASGSSPAAGFSTAFFDAVQGAGLGVTQIEAFGIAPSPTAGSPRGLSFLPTSLGSLPERVGAICSFGPLPASPIRDLKSRYPSARLVACLDSPLDFKTFESTVESSDAVVVAHGSFADSIPSAARRGDANNRLLELAGRGLLFCIMPGIDLKKYDPAFSRRRYLTRWRRRPGMTSVPRGRPTRRRSGE